MTPDLSMFQTEEGELVQEQQQQHPVVSTSPHPVTLLATSNGTHIAVQLSLTYTEVLPLKVFFKEKKEETENLINIYCTLALFCLQLLL